MGSGSRIQCCCSCSVSWSYSSDLLPSRGTFICPGSSQKRKKKKNIYIYMYIYIRVSKYIASQGQRKFTRCESMFHYAYSKGNCSLFCFVFFFFYHTHSIWKFLDQGLNWNHSCGNAGSLTHCPRAGTLLLSAFYIAAVLFHVISFWIKYSMSIGEMRFFS